MAMLAEKKRKVKMPLNPRGNDWAKDENKFGQKLLEKMGWSPGTGLGPQGQGRTDCIRVNIKMDTKGFGNKEKYAEAWTKQQEKFDILLSQLNGVDKVDSTKVVIPSLEDKSKKSKARVHYHKFTRGKDVSKYSSKDLNSIIGVTEKQLEDSTVSGNSMYDYFKMKSKKLNRVTYEDKSYVEISDSFAASGDEGVNESEKIDKYSKKINSKRKTFAIEETTVENNHIKQSEISLEDARCMEISDSFPMSEGGNDLENLYEDKAKKKKKKKAKQKTLEIKESNNQDLSGNEDQSEIPVQEIVSLENSGSFPLSGEDNEVFADKENKKRKKSSKRNICDNEENFEQSTLENASLEISGKKKKNLKKREENIIQEVIGVQESNDVDNINNDINSQPGKKKKKRHQDRYDS